jgi:NAD(P)-dependent dehydrogenase (short-subunit alcohol dehydrogenase family)
MKHSARQHISGDMELNDKVVLITGGRRIGQAVAHELAARGAHIALAYRGSKSEAETSACEARKLGRKATVIQADVSKSGDCEMLVERTVDELGHLDVVINMASLYAPEAFDSMSEASWDRNLGINLKSAFMCSYAAARVMRTNGGGRIINFADWLAGSGRPNYQGFTAYYVAKAGVIALTEAMALELAASGVLVNAIAPGPILPPPDMDEGERHDVAAATPVGRWGGEQEIVKAVLALIDTDFITGETIRVDGGRHLK